MRTAEKEPLTPSRNAFKGWEKGPHGGITVTEGYSVVSAPRSFPLGRGNGGRKEREVLGF